MTDRSRDLLTIMKQTAGDAWPEVLQEATVSLLVEALLQESGQTDVTHLFEARTSASLVLSILTVSSRLVKLRCTAVEYLCVDWQCVGLDKMHNGYCSIVCMHGRLSACFHAGLCPLQHVATTHIGITIASISSVKHSKAWADALRFYSLLSTILSTMLSQTQTLAP